MNDIFILDINVWKELPNVNYQENIHNLALDIQQNGLINPISVLYVNKNVFKIIDGNKRYLAMTQLNKTKILCNIIKQNIKQNIKHKTTNNNTEIITNYYKKILCDVFSNKG